MMCGTAAGSRVTETAPARHRWSNPTETALNWVPPNNTCPPPCNENRVHISDWTTSTTPSREEKINIQNSKRDSFPKGVLRSSTSVDFCASNVSHFLYIYYHSKCDISFKVFFMLLEEVSYALKASFIWSKIQCNLKIQFSILVYFNFFQFSAAITPVFSVTWFMRNHSNIPRFAAQKTLISHYSLQSLNTW